jgi:hypothetical protein
MYLCIYAIDSPNLQNFEPDIERIKEYNRSGWLE